ncbi:glycoside hydrolase [Paenibacillus sp. FSL R7-277]|uniref:family 43 glycosylhydrolase n=1 Tax=Paenibacillus sp. FSL R7-277 TaxID=1227352 RepID=UPI0003E269C3|nr:family 43 glycosylhydrolase [Paenibacillus sp. FSL R7-277]ETT73280.1 glycoside hydrolase [Paenibacillus sp. FSL R7-277]
MKKQAYNPFIPSYEYIPDPEPYVFDGRIYVFGSHDKFNGTTYCMNNYVGWSASVNDLGDWKYEGVIYDKVQDPLSKQTGNHYLYAPDVARGVDGRYYLYYSLSGTHILSVAVCDTPAGKYEFYGHVQDKAGHVLGSDKGEYIQFDPAVLVDDDERVYLYSGYNPPVVNSYSGRKVVGAFVMELESDMLTVKEGPKVVLDRKEEGFGSHHFFEASSIRKIKGTYYFIYSSRHSHELCYATSRYPDRDFKYGGTIISNADIYLNGRQKKEALNYFGNNHGSLVEINGTWYIFHHRHTNKNPYSRQACAEKIVIEEDGSIKQVEMTSCGLNGKPLKGEGTYEAGIACNLMSKKGARGSFLLFLTGKGHPYLTQEGEDREGNSNQYISNFRNGATAGFKYFEFEGTNRIGIVTRGNATGKVKVSTELGGKAVAEIEVSSSEQWKHFEGEMTSLNRVYPLYFTFEGKGKLDLISFDLIKTTPHYKDKGKLE